MALKYKCKYCGTGTNDPRKLCYFHRDKYKIIKESGMFGGTAKRKKYSVPPLDTYNHKLGSETQKLVDFVNKSGTIHYGRVVAKLGVSKC